MKKKLLSLLLSIVMVLSLMPIAAFADGTTYTGTGTGSGTESDPWQISTLAQLNDLADAVNGEGTYAGNASDMSDKYFKLTADIGSASAPFTKVIGKNPGYPEDPHFAGNFDGDGHTVWLNIAVESSSVSDEFAGMFGLREATISNLTVKGTVSANNTTANAKDVYAGGIAGWANYSTFDNCRSECTVTAQKSGASGCAYAGGICGYSSNSNTVVNCSSSGSVTATGGKATYAGGIAGYNSNGNMDNGGSKIKNSFSNAAVTASGSSFSIAGGIAGYNYNNSSSSSNISIIANCYYSGSSVSGDTNTTGGVCGSVFHDATVTNSYYDSTVLTGKNAVGGTTDTADAKGLPTTDMKAASGTTGALVDLLNGYRESDIYPSNFKTWTVSSGSYPLFTDMMPPVTDYGITVNDVSVTETNKTNVLNDGKVSYDPAADKLSVGAFGSDLTIVGNDTVDIELDGGTQEAVHGNLTITKANNVTATATGGGENVYYVLNGNVNISCTGNVTITPKEYIGGVGYKLTVNGAKNVTVSGGTYHTLLDGQTEIDCTGDVYIDANGGFPHEGLTITNAVNVTVKGKQGDDASIHCSGEVLFQNSGNYISFDDITITGATNVTVLGDYGGSLLQGTINITCTGDVLLKNTHSNGGPTVYGTLTVTGARNVTAEATYDGGTLRNATLTCSGDVNIINHGTGQAISNLTVNSAKNVNVIGSWTYAILGKADITSSGDVLVKNTGDGNAVYKTVDYARMTGAGDYLVKTGDTESALTTVATKAESEAYSAASCEKKIINILTAYTVTVQSDGNGTTSADKTSAAKGETVTLTATANTGYHFKEWQSSDVTVSGSTFIMPEKNVTVKAIFEQDTTPPVPTTYTVTVENDGNGSASADKTSAAKGETVTLTATPAAGYHFKEWQSSDVTVSGSTFIMPEKNVTVKAIFEQDTTPPVPTTYTVSFNMNGHGTQITAQTVESGSKATKPADPKASGYTFGGWYADATFSTKFDFNTAITANTTVYAKWTKNPVTPPTPGEDHGHNVHHYDPDNAIVIGGKSGETAETNPDTGAPVLSMSTGMIFLAGIALILAKKK